MKPGRALFEEGASPFPVVAAVIDVAAQRLEALVSLGIERVVVQQSLIECIDLAVVERDRAEGRIDESEMDLHGPRPPLAATG